MSEEILDLRASLSAVRRRWLLVGGLGAAGLCAGLTFGIVNPPMTTANALVLLPAAATTTPGVAVPSTGTQVVIATSTPVLRAAGAAAGSPMSPQTMVHRVSVRPLSDSVLSITASAPRPRQAELLANAVASSYVRFVTSSGATASGQVLTGLDSEAAQLTKTVHALQGQIAAATAQLATEPATSSAGAQEASLLGSLHTEQASLSQQLNGVENQIVDTRLSDSLAGGGVRVLQHASTATVPSGWWLVSDAAIGLGGGLGLGAIIALVAGSRDRRLRRRADIASALGVPVIASVHAAPRRDVAGWRRLLDDFQPSPHDLWSVRQARRRLDADGDGPRSHVAALTLATDRAAQAGAVQMAISSALTGVPTSLRVGHHDSLVALRAACQVQPPPRASACLSTNAPDVAPDAPGTHAPAGGGSAAELVLTVEALDRADPVVHAGPATSGVLAVSAGFATVDELARAALAISEGGMTLAGILVVNPDPGDHTTGDIGMSPALQAGRPVDQNAVRSLVEQGT